MFAALSKTWGKCGAGIPPTPLRAFELGEMQCQGVNKMPVQAWAGMRSSSKPSLRCSSDTDLV